MRYQELHDEYNNLLNSYSALQLELSSLPKGALSTKTISGKEYVYHQYTSNGKRVSKCLKENEAIEMACKIEKREKAKTELEYVLAELSRLESAVNILDKGMGSLFSFLRQSADMDAVPVAKRANALSFAKAMTALEGLPARQKTEDNLAAWSEGRTRFADIYIPVLREYNVLEVAYE